MTAQRATTLLAASLALLLPLAHAQQPNPVPQKYKNVYPQPSQADRDVQQAMKLAAQQHKRVILDFGTDQCAECQVLAGFWTTTTNQAQVAERFLLVHINVGPKSDQNVGLGHRFQAEVKYGIPIVVVTESDGKIVEVTKEFERAHNESAEDLTAFLNKARS